MIELIYLPLAFICCVFPLWRQVGETQFSADSCCNDLPVSSGTQFTYFVLTEDSDLQDYNPLVYWNLLLVQVCILILPSAWLRHGPVWRDESLASIGHWILWWWNLHAILLLYLSCLKIVGFLFLITSGKSYCSDDDVLIFESSVDLQNFCKGDTVMLFFWPYFAKCIVGKPLESTVIYCYPNSYLW